MMSAVEVLTHGFSDRRMPYTRPSQVPLGVVFRWKDQMWRRGKGKLYRARPQSRVLLAESWQRRYNRQMKSGRRSRP
jgi:hypothetical protein